MYKAQFAQGSCPYNACIDNIEDFFFVSVFLHFQEEAELTELSSFLNYPNFVLGSQRIFLGFLKPKKKIFFGYDRFLEYLTYRKGLLIASLFIFFLL